MAWVAATGTSLLLVAAVVFTVTNWEVIPSGFKLAALLAATGLTIFAGERLKLPTVARALQHLGALLVPVSTASVAITVGADWPEVCLAAGAAGVAAAGWAGTLRRAPVLLAAVPLAVVLGLAGVAGRTAAPLPVLVALAAVGAVVGRQQVHGARLGLIAGLAPLAAALDALPVGAGTAARLGLTGEVLGWTGPTAGLLAAVALGLIAHQRRSMAYAIAMVAAALAGVLVGASALDTEPQSWAVLAAAALASIFAAALGTRRDPFWCRLTLPLANLAELVLVPLAFVATIVVVTVGSAVEPQPGWALAALLAAVGALVGSRLPKDERISVDGLLVALAGLGGTAVVALVTANTEWTVAAAVALAAAALVGRVHPTVTGLAGALAVATATLGWFADGAAALPATALPAGTVLAGASLVAAALALLAGRFDRERSDMTPLLSAVLVAPWALDLPAGAALTAAGLLAVAAASELLRLRNPLAPWLAVVPVALGAVLGHGAPVDAAVLGAGWALWTALAIGRGPGASAPWPGPWRARLAAATLGAVAALSAGPLGGELVVVGWGLVIAAVAVSGVGFTRARLSLVETVAAGLFAAALGCGFALADVSLCGAALALAGAVIVVHGWLGKALTPSVVGSSMAALGIVMIVEDSGVVPWLIDRLAPYGVTGEDVGVFIAGCLLALGGAVVARLRPLSPSWLTVSPALGLVGLHLVGTLVATGQPWRGFVALGIGVVAVAVGGWRRLAAPLLLGTAMVALSVVLLARNGLATLPVWSWLALGGAFLLGVAVLLERKAADARAEGRGLVEAVLAEFR